MPHRSRPEPLASFSEHFNVDPDEMERLGVFDPILERDSNFAINPKLLDETAVPEFQGARNVVLRRFRQVMDLLAEADRGEGTLWQAAFRLFNFPEFEGAAIGYSERRGDGRGWPKTVRRATLLTGYDMVRAGIRNPRIFELVGLFQDRVGVDLISDMIGTILREPLIRYAQRVSQELGAPLTPVRGIRAPGLPTYLNERNAEKYVILLPRDILSEAPVALDQGDIADVASANDEVRAYLNRTIGYDWARRRKLDKTSIRRALIQSADFAEEVLRQYERSRATAYDFNHDPRDQFRFLQAAKYAALQERVQFSVEHIESPEDAIAAVRDLLMHFRRLVEQTRVGRAMYNDGWTPRGEKGVQDVFHAVAAMHSVFTGLDVSPEVLTGHGTVDYKFTLGRSVVIVVEIKLAKSMSLVDGLTQQLPAYATAEQADHAFYLVVNNGGAAAVGNLRRLTERTNDRDAGGFPEVIVCDATRQPTASRRRERRP